MQRQSIIIKTMSPCLNLPSFKFKNIINNIKFKKYYTRIKYVNEKFLISFWVVLFLFSFSYRIYWISIGVVSNLAYRMRTNWCWDVSSSWWPTQTTAFLAPIIWFLPILQQNNRFNFLKFRDETFCSSVFPDKTLKTTANMSYFCTWFCVM